MNQGGRNRFQAATAASMHGCVDATPRVWRGCLLVRARAFSKTKRQGGDGNILVAIESTIPTSSCNFVFSEL